MGRFGSPPVDHTIGREPDIREDGIKLEVPAGHLMWEAHLAKLGSRICETTVKALIPSPARRRHARLDARFGDETRQRSQSL